MKYLIVFLSSTIISISVIAQTTSKKNELACPDCKIDCMCKLFFDSFLPDSNKRNLIKKEWNDFFGNDLESTFPIHKGMKVVSVKFDGLGCIYPETLSSLNEVGSDFLDAANTDYTKFNKESFQRLYKNKLNGLTNNSIDAFIVETGFNDFKPTMEVKTKKKDIDYFEFINKWNSKYLPFKISEIKKNLSSEIKKIIIFIHGYNVPYSLAHLQGNIIAETILEEDTSLKSENVLFIRVFWPSGYLKNSDFNETSCDYSNIENIETMWAYTYVSNGAYLSAITLRRIVSGIGGNLPIDIIAHSHGATVATTALINTTNKLQRGELSKKIKTYMESVELPDREIYLFLNAPAIPGKSTFSNIDNIAIQRKFHFFIGYNLNDQVLLKQKLKIRDKPVKWIKPTRHLSSTTLGCNKKNEVRKTKHLFEAKGISENFNSGINSTQTEHDFFCYIKQEKFKDNLRSFFADRKK